MLSKQERDEKVADIKQYHENVMSLISSEYIFYPKTVNTYQGVNYISLYERELVNTNFFTELCNESVEITDPLRTLYQWKGNKHCIEEYKKYENSFGVKYSVPLEEFIKVNTKEILEKYSIVKPSKVKKISTKSVKPEEIKYDILEIDKKDEYIDKLTIRDKCAIEWKKPVSEKKWLNELIKQQFDK